MLVTFSGATMEQLQSGEMFAYQDFSDPGKYCYNARLEKDQIYSTIQFMKVGYKD